MSSTIRTRFAPSPTGFIHIGNIRTALFNWLFARSQGGKFLLRLEDTDQARSTEEACKMILEALAWLGMDWDDEVVRQTQRLDLYRQKAEDMVKLGLAYRCYCTKEEIEAVRQEQIKQKQNPRYNRKCRNLKKQPTDKPYVIRFCMPETGTVKFTDMVLGAVEFPNQELDDFIMLRTDGLPTYNFAVVVDDNDFGITDVIRGADHLSNTPKQINVYQALGYDIPNFAHLPLITGSGNAKLSKRNAESSFMYYKEQGYLPEAMINYLARLGWGYGDQEFFSTEDLVSKFSIDRVGKSPASFDGNKLLALNAEHLRKKEPEAIWKLWIPFLAKECQVSETEVIDKKDILLAALPALLVRSNTLLELAQKAKFYVVEKIDYDEKAVQKFFRPEIIPVLEDLIKGLENLPPTVLANQSEFEQELEGIFRGLMEQYKLGMGKIAQPVRVALTGSTISPGIFEIVAVLGKERVIKRLKQALTIIQNNN